jgi:hypothetical protein
MENRKPTRQIAAVRSSSLFDQDERYTPQAMEIEREFLEAIRPVFQRFAASGVSRREMHILLINCIADVVSEDIIARTQEQH